MDEQTDRRMDGYDQSYYLPASVVGKNRPCQFHYDMKLPTSELRLLEKFPGWLGSRVVSVLDSGAEGPGFKLHLRCCRVTVLGKLFTSIMPLFTKQQNW